MFWNEVIIWILLNWVFESGVKGRVRNFRASVICPSSNLKVCPGSIRKIYFICILSKSVIAQKEDFSSLKRWVLIVCQMNTICFIVWKFMQMIKDSKNSEISNFSDWAFTYFCIIIHFFCIIIHTTSHTIKNHFT